MCQYYQGLRVSKIDQNIDVYIDLISQQGIKVEFCYGIKPKIQEGQTCKLNAGVVVQEYVYLQGHPLPPLPLHKNGQFPDSLRKRAKQTVNSQVGEIYGAKQIKEVFDYNDFETVSYCITDRSIYEKFLIESLKQQQPVIAYFDVTPKIGPEEKQGMPNLYQGKMEHGAVVSGYYYLNDKLRLIIAQWGDFYDISFDELFASTSQLSQIKPPEHYQKYYPIPGFFYKRKWLEKEQMKDACDYMCDNQDGFLRDAVLFLNDIWPKDNERITSPPIDNSACLANVLTIISSDAVKIELKEFSAFQLNFDTKEKLVIDEEKIASASNFKFR